ncbi:hypothetical protein A5821_001259 [Enterococcus sp. 7F3_DIV0205]|uniref:WxL domain-containing protein n=1 Tax=Candidatus Enterococcus palustris TaxID=1834189 RepID=A0AAQ3W7H3_9ENTE|nr:WxL domain-containing protein [Enterococcus sp. 7F3_DIV0205]OTN85657.1 hypothetical protein A5821_001603 [Enterococcus sp. 7F3_DIV0205]
MKRNRLLAFLLVFICLSAYPKISKAEEQNTGNHASSQVSITFVQDNTPLKSKETPNDKGGILGDLGLGQGKRLPNTGEVKMILWIATGYLVLLMLCVTVGYYYLIGGRKMKLWKSMFVTTLLLGSIAAPSVSLATDNTVGDESGKKDAQSFGSVNLQAGEDDKPGKPEVPGDEEGGETGNTGLLAITYVSPLDFGDVQLTGQEQVKTAKNEDPSLQIRDIRGTGKGWTVQVSMTEFKQKTNDKIIMKGAALYLPKGTAKASGATTSSAPTTKEVEVNDKPQTIFEAKPGTSTDIVGAGAWMDKFGKETVKLTIPQDALVGDYQAQLTWTISDTPGKK